MKSYFRFYLHILIIKCENNFFFVYRDPGTHGSHTTNVYGSMILKIPGIFSSERFCQERQMFIAYYPLIDS